MPVVWQPGDGVIIPPTSKCCTAKDRKDGLKEMECKDWFFSTKKLDIELILKKIIKD